MTAPKVVIVGAGPAGTRAAEVLVNAGLRPTVLDEAPRSGGQIYRRPPEAIQRDAGTVYGFDAGRATRLHATFDALAPKIDYRSGTSVWDAAGNQIHVVSGDTVQTVEWDALILATGAMDRVIPFPGWTAPGVFTLGAAQVSLKSQATAIGSSPVFFGTGPLLYLVAYQYLKVGIRPAAILDTSLLVTQVKAAPKLAFAGAGVLAKGLFYVAALRLAGIPIKTGVMPLATEMDSVGRLQAFNWKGADGKLRRTDCDALAFGFHLVSQTQIADLLGLDFEFDTLQRQWLPKQDGSGRALGRDHVYLAGDGARVLGADAAEVAGQQAALSLLCDFGHACDAGRTAKLSADITNAHRLRKLLDGEMFPYPTELAAAIGDEVVVCRCEGITAGTLRRAATGLGATDINRVKAFTRSGMGRCQGRVCGSPVAEILASALSRPIDQVGRLRAQAPLKPTPLSALARVKP